jgi:serine/threonine protein phosphatase 1
MQLLYVIGDVHGMSRQLRALVKRCRRHAAGRPMKFVFIGDYIDRGPDSRGVIEFLMHLEAKRPDEAIFLMGNHETLALSAVARSDFMNDWVDNGGASTLRSYGAASAAELPEDHVEWLRSLAHCCDDGQRFFVHAGINPDKPLDEQDWQDLLWIREPFLSDHRDYGRLIVHGHTPTRDGMPDLRRNRLNIDTGAVFGGPLTAAVFTAGQTDPIDFVQVRISTGTG